MGLEHVLAGGTVVYRSQALARDLASVERPFPAIAGEGLSFWDLQRSAGSARRRRDRAMGDARLALHAGRGGRARVRALAARGHNRELVCALRSMGRRQLELPMFLRAQAS